MFRMTTLALAAVTVIGAAAFTPAPASAHSGWHRSGWHQGWRHHHRARPGLTIRFHAPRAYAYAPRCYTQRRWVDTRWGWRLRKVRICR